MRRRGAGIVGDSLDLDVLEKRGASFVRRPDDHGDAVPRHRGGSSSARAAAPYHSHFTGNGIFGISAYGLILLGAALVLTILVYLLVRALAFLTTHYL
ncbi:hypothetical protein WHR41_01705 [Cladosporium halotolerans]|uniref:Uncharacterized protein n=1 Tax=Cladosporium halotolerans TaxID=1052096 RepID=A0AB34L1S0_9PEZI